MRTRLYLVEDVDRFRIRACTFEGLEIKAQRQICSFAHEDDPERAKREAQVCLRALRKAATGKRKTRA